MHSVRNRLCFEGQQLQCVVKFTKIVAKQRVLSVWIGYISFSTILFGYLCSPTIYLWFEDPETA